MLGALAMCAELFFIKQQKGRIVIIRCWSLSAVAAKVVSRDLDGE